MMKTIFQYILLFTLICCVLNAQQKIGEDFTFKREIEKRAYKVGEKNEITFNVFNSNSELAYSINTEIDYDLPFPALYLFPDGKAVVISTFIPKVEFYNSEGELINSIMPLDKPKPEYERSVYVDGSNNFAALLVTEPGVKFGKVFIYSSTGELINSWEIEDQYCSAITLIPETRSVITSTFNWKDEELRPHITFFTFDGRTKNQAPGNFTRSKIYEDNILLFSNKDLFIADKSGSSITRKFTAQDEIIMGAEILGDKIYLLLSNDEVLQIGLRIQ